MYGRGHAQILRLILLLRALIVIIIMNVLVSSAQGCAMPTLGLETLLEGKNQVFQGFVSLFVLGCVQAIGLQIHIAQWASELATHLTTDVLHDEVVLIISLNLLQILQYLFLRVIN